jgi:hypothetical protein
LVKNDADFNDDGVVDGADFLTWQRGVGAADTHRQGDANGSGSVDAADFAEWKTQFGAADASGWVEGAAVPEPTTLVLSLSIGLVGLGVRPRRGRFLVMNSPSFPD